MPTDHEVARMVAQDAVNELGRVEGLLSRIAAADPSTINSSENGVCFYCYADERGHPGYWHDENCVWVLARQLLGLPIPVNFGAEDDWLPEHHRIGEPPACPDCEDGWDEAYENHCESCHGTASMRLPAPFAQPEWLLPS